VSTTQPTLESRTVAWINAHPGWIGVADVREGLLNRKRGVTPREQDALVVVIKRLAAQNRIKSRIRTGPYMTYGRFEIASNDTEE